VALEVLKSALRWPTSDPHASHRVNTHFDCQIPRPGRWMPVQCGTSWVCCRSRLRTSHFTFILTPTVGSIQHKTYEEKDARIYSLLRELVNAHGAILEASAISFCVYSILLHSTINLVPPATKLLLRVAVIFYFPNFWLSLPPYTVSSHYTECRLTSFQHVGCHALLPWAEIN
jgi:hypothetical protein